MKIWILEKAWCLCIVWNSIVSCRSYRRLHKQFLQEWGQLYTLWWLCKQLHLQLCRWLRGHALRYRFDLNTDVNSVTEIFDAVQKTICWSAFSTLYQDIFMRIDVRGIKWCEQIILHDCMLYGAACPRLQSDGVILNNCETDEGFRCF